MIVRKSAKEKLKPFACMFLVKPETFHRMPAYFGTGCAAAGKGCVGLPVPCLYSVMLEKRYRQKGDLLQGVDPGGILTKIFYKSGVYGVIKRLETKGFQCNISKAAGVTVV